ncbi:hypothetical protein ROZALSC1DRAFT_28618 [Rozella allomycis CSF55]|uniref:Retinoic acid induced 16-like protein domain-containing protein n=1 Tax=Rozella allomycis (strain CSF55) TaxID=988480 RepID=A0A075AUN6_ROZAC|nr:Retinoic acid induced 16-like protein domain-containing protein [Rozella allomycis CSF55]RKP19829.1 hypothetical protein ROZALSC1DRAFT_28618 [Rozella allomycis CSF55]|eukprot:EPZ33875.1 Retinoic acid induced 16-like protein domain-containing protein [Rozella allomycis CSF55]
MNFFAQLASQFTSPSKTIQPTNTTVVLSKFHRIWDFIYKSLSVELRNKNNVILHHTDIPANFRAIVDILVEEEARTDVGSTGICMEYLLKNNILQQLFDMSERDVPEGVLGETVRLFTSLIENLNDKFLVHLNIHRPTLQLLSKCVEDQKISMRYEDELVELVFSICNRIHSFPELLTIFYNDLDRRSKSQSIENLNSNNSMYGENEFLLFSYLMRFISSDVSSVQKFVINCSDLCSQVSFHLHGLFAQLPKTIDYEIDLSMEGSRLNLNDEESFTQLEKSDKNLLLSFLNLLDFAQNILIKSKSSLISELLCESISENFLEKNMTPSFLHSSDSDGTYLLMVYYSFHIVKFVHEDSLSELFINYFLKRGPDYSSKGWSKIESTDLKTVGLQPFFISKLQSSTDIAIITLKFLSTMIKLHSPYALPLLINGLVENKDVVNGTPFLYPRSFHFSVCKALANLLNPETLEMGYDSHVSEANSSIAFHLQRIAQKEISDTNTLPSQGISFLHHHLSFSRELSKEDLKSSCTLNSSPFINSILDQFSKFWMKSSQFNTALIDLIVELISCPEPLVYIALIAGFEQHQKCLIQILNTLFKSQLPPLDLSAAIKELYITGIFPSEEELSKYSPLARNVILLEEFVKRLFATFEAHGLGFYCLPFYD